MAIDNQRMLQYSVYGLGVVTWFVLYNIMAGTASVVYVLLNRAEPIIPLFENFTYLSMFISVAITAAAAEYARRNPVTNKFGVEVISEMRKVSWPSYKDVRGTTAVVLGVTAVVAVILFLFDSVYSALIKWALSLGGGA